MLFKSLFYCSWLIMFLCSLGWQRKLSSICTSAWEFLLWGMTVIHLPGHAVPKNNLILVFSLSKITGSLSTFWALITKFPSHILTTTLSVSSTEIITPKTLPWQSSSPPQTFQWVSSSSGLWRSEGEHHFPHTHVGYPVMNSLTTDWHWHWMVTAGWGTRWGRVSLVPWHPSSISYSLLEWAC